MGNGCEAGLHRYRIFKWYLRSRMPKITIRFFVNDLLRSSFYSGIEKVVSIITGTWLSTYSYVWYTFAQKISDIRVLFLLCNGVCVCVCEWACFYFWRSSSQGSTPYYRCTYICVYYAIWEHVCRVYKYDDWQSTDFWVLFHHSLTMYLYFENEKIVTI